MNRLLLLTLTLLGTHVLMAGEAPQQSAGAPPQTRPTSPGGTVLRYETVDLAAAARLFSTDPVPLTDADIPLFDGPVAITAPIHADPLFTRPAGTDLFLLQDLPAATKPKLLPDQMSFMERGLWGEDGLFRSWGITGPLTPENRKHELDVRRTMLTMHQIGGFTTLASMITTVYFGQRYLDTHSAHNRDMHRTFVPITIGLYAATGLLSILSPPPLLRRDEVSSTSIHKILAWVHAVGMIVTPILGAAIRSRDASFDDTARFHQIEAYITTAALTAAMVIITF